MIQGLLACTNIFFEYRPMDQTHFSAFSRQPSFEQFRKAVAERKLPLVLICGAGLSSDAKLPTWHQLRKKLERHASQKVKSLNQMGHQLLNGKLKTAKNTKDYWLSFDLIAEILSEPTFRNYIIEYLTPAENAPVPAAYSELLRFDLRGVVTLNLDKFSGEALAAANLGRLITPVHGLELGRKWNVIRHAEQYLVYLHGELSDPANWVLTRTHLQSLLESKAHDYFLTDLYLNNLVLFVGISADDIALSARLLEARKAGFDPPALFWLTPRLDASVMRWASDSGISLILYQAPDTEDHLKVIKYLVSECRSYLPQDDPKPVPQIKTELFDINEEPSEKPLELAQLLPEQIRKILSNRLQHQLSNCEDERVYEEFQKFCKKYRFALSRAFYKDEEEEFSNWFNLKLNFPSLGRGNFGEVFLANDKKENSIAVKILHENILSDSNMLGGFRRGVRSMRILSEANIPGIVPILDSFELPPTIVMEHVEGITLDDAISARPNLPWLIKLSVAKKISQILHKAHSLPKTVMHRDLKPSNIMIRNFEYTGFFDPDVVVLDFDMSWHKGSSEKDVVFESRDDFGYLAPEQTTQVKEVSAVSTRVDAYGLGMTIFFLFGGAHPRPNEGLSERWFDLAYRATKNGYKEAWISAPYRIARLIRNCTQIQQRERLDFAIAMKELEDVEGAILGIEPVTNPELFAEEIMCRLDLPISYEWKGGSAGGVVQLRRGLEIRCFPNFREETIMLEFKYVDQGIENYARLKRQLTTAPESAAKALGGCGWKIHEKTSGGGQLAIRAAVTIEDAQTQLDKILIGAKEAYRITETIFSM